MRDQLERIVFWSQTEIIRRTESKQICIEKNETLTLFNSIQIVKMVI